VASIRIDPVEPLRPIGRVICQRAVHTGQGGSDQLLLSRIQAGERMAGHPGQQCQPAFTDVDRELPVGCGHRGTSGDSRLLQPSRDTQTACELATRGGRNCLRYPPVTFVIDEPRCRAHATIVDGNAGISEVPMPPQPRRQHRLGDHRVKSTKPAQGPPAIIGKGLQFGLQFTVARRVPGETGQGCWSA
jgi:hypothetical protein